METPYARVMWRLLDPADRLIGRWRAAAVARLALTSGDWVIDAGCGTGSSFPFLLQAIGPTGRVVGIEIDSFLAAKANDRTRRHGWANVHVIRADAQSVVLQPQFDGLLLFAAHEVLRSPKALNALLAGLKDGARVVAWGAKQARSFPGRMVNPLLRLVSRRWLPGSVPIDTQPWRLLEARLELTAVEVRVAGIVYLVTGVLPPTTRRRAD